VTSTPRWSHAGYFGLIYPAGAKKGRAWVLLLLWNQKAEPCTAFVPLLIWTLIAAPPAKPCSASKEFVTTSTVSMASSEGM